MTQAGSTASKTDALKELFGRRFGGATETIAPLKADGSARQLFRLSGGGKTAIGALGPDAQENRAFLAFSKHFRKEGLPVPEIYAEDQAAGTYIEEDLGDTTLFALLSGDRKGRDVSPPAADAYRRVVRILPEFQVTAGKSLDYSLCYPRASFDKQSMMWDLNYFKYYFLKLGNIPFNEQALEDDFKRFVDFLLKAKHDYFLYRDFQSHNIMIREKAPWFIDYQGGRKGPLQYDLASLLYDAKADLPFEFRDELTALYLDAAAKLTKVDPAEFLRYFHGFVFIRIMQAMGAYGLRGFYEKKPRFLQSIPYAIRNLEHLLRTAQLPIELPELMAVFRRMVASTALRQHGNVDLALTVRIMSFSYKNGVPGDDRGHGGGFVFDCRALPNPGRFEQYAKVTGKDAPVIEFLKKEPDVAKYLENAFSLVDQSVENYRSRKFTSLMVAFGCTGGQHRSVYCAERLAAHLKQKYDVLIDLKHRDAPTEPPAS
ncbi:MAG: phosphotransferase [Elusimicrobia bacterium]|nr:phosphotransferase [Elusimicrobiota bacterium]